MNGGRRLINARGPAALILSIFVLFGCASESSLDRQRVWGSVTLDGQPLPDGAILLEPASEASGTAVGSTIHDGQFVIERADGPVPGLYTVRIYASSSVQAPAPPGASTKKPRPMVELVPEKYNTHTELRARIFTRKINSLRYELLSGD